MITKYNIYNESLRDKMTGKSKEEVDNALDKLLEGDYDRILGNLTSIMNLLGMNYPDEIYFTILKEMDINLIKKHIGSIIKSVANTDFTNRIINKYMMKIKNIRTHNDLFDFVLKIDDEIGDVYYRDEILRRLIKKNDLDKTKDIIKNLVVYGVNESIRDKMTPKSREDSKKVFEEIIKNFSPISNDKSVVISWGIIDMLKFMGETKDSMCLVQKNDKFYNALDSFFDSLTINKKRVLENEWLYWKELKLAYNNINNGTWLFSKDMDYTDLNINESIRDKMTPKSDMDVERTRQDIIEYIRNIVRSNGGYITMSRIELSVYDSPVISEVRTNDQGLIYHTITSMYIDDVKVKEYYNWNGKLISRYRVKYEDLSPDALLMIKGVIKEGVNSGVINESIRSKMTPKPKDDIIKHLNNLDLKEEELKAMWLGTPSTDKVRYLFGNLYHIKNILTDDEIVDLFKHLPSHTKVDIGCTYNYIPLIRQAIKDGVDKIWLSSGLITNTNLNGDIEVFKFLLDNGADPWVSNGAPLDWAHRTGNDEKVKILKKIMYNLKESLRDKMTPISKEKMNQVDFRKMRILDFSQLAELWISGDNDLKKKIEKHIYYLPGDNEWGESNLYDLRRAIRLNYDKEEYIHTDLFSKQREREMLTNESIRDKMTPKTEDDILKTLENENIQDYREDILKITKKIHKSMNKMGLNMDYPISAAFIDSLRDYTKSYIIQNNQLKDKQMDDLYDLFLKGYNIVSYDGDKDSFEEMLITMKQNNWELFDKDEYESDEGYNVEYIFVKKPNKIISVTESIRDKMTPKSDEEIRKVIKKKFGMTDDYLKVKIPIVKDVKKVRTLLTLSDEYNIDIKDYDDKNLIIYGDIIDVFNFMKFYLNYSMINKQNKSNFYIEYILKNKEN